MNNIEKWQEKAPFFGLATLVQEAFENPNELSQKASVLLPKLDHLSATLSQQHWEGQVPPENIQRISKATEAVHALLMSTPPAANVDNSPVIETTIESPFSSENTTAHTPLNESITTPEIQISAILEIIPVEIQPPIQPILAPSETTVDTNEPFERVDIRAIMRQFLEDEAIEETLVATPMESELTQVAEPEIALKEEEIDDLEEMDEGEDMDIEEEIAEEESEVESESVEIVQLGEFPQILEPEERTGIEQFEQVAISTPTVETDIIPIREKSRLEWFQTWAKVPVIQTVENAPQSQPSDSELTKQYAQEVSRAKAQQDYAQPSELEKQRFTLPVTPLAAAQPFFRAEDAAKKSAEDDATIATETLALIYTEQGLFDKAASVYQRLMVKFPEKSAYFALCLAKLPQE
jgi:hypothetical protein